MTFILVSLSLLAIFVFASVFYDIVSIADPTHYNPYSQELLSPIAEFYLSERPLLDSEQKEPAHTQILSIQRSNNPFRLQLYWDSDSMFRVPERIGSEATETSESAALPRVTKRFSIQLPLASSGSVDTLSPEVESQRCISPDEVIEESDSGSFLVALAAQERRVLELKEELHKAESDLTKLKRQWAHHEALRKKQERQQAQPLRSIRSPTKGEFLTQEGKSRSELATRRPVATRAKQTQRKVFEGGRHTRALSLLSPTSMVNRGSISSPIERSGVEPGPKTAIPRVSTPVHIKQQSLDMPRDDIVTTGKQIMDDLKEGLWTFIEDLRQATVGEEAISPSRIHHGVTMAKNKTKMVNSASGEDLITLNRASYLQDAPTKLKRSAGHATFPTLPTPSRASVTDADIAASIVSKATSDDDNEAWDDWDPQPSKDVSSDCSSTIQSTPRSSVSLDSKERNGSLDSISWPALQKLTPGNLTRTASALMNDWERSLSSSPNKANRP